MFLTSDSLLGFQPRCPHTPFPTCRAPNSIISSSVQSISSSRMAQRACSYSCVRRTASYYTNTETVNNTHTHCQRTPHTHTHTDLGVYFIEGKVFKAKANFVIFLNSLLQETTGWVQPPEEMETNIFSSNKHFKRFWFRRMWPTPLLEAQQIMFSKVLENIPAVDMSLVYHAGWAVKFG